MKRCPKCGFNLKKHREELKAVQLSEEKALRNEFNQWHDSSPEKKTDFRKSLKLIPIFGIIVLMTFFLVSHGADLKELYWVFFILYSAEGLLLGTLAASFSRQNKKYNHWKGFLVQKGKKYFPYV